MKWENICYILWTGEWQHFKMYSKVNSIWMLYISLFFKNHTFKKEKCIDSYKHSITNVEKNF